MFRKRPQWLMYNGSLINLDNVTRFKVSLENAYDTVVYYSDSDFEVLYHLSVREIYRYIKYGKLPRKREK